MLDTLQQLDNDIFLSLNGSTGEWLDNFSWYFSGKLVWGFFYAAILASFFYRYGWRRALGLLLLIVLIIAVCDQLCGNFVRHSIERMRPSNPNNPISDMVHIVNGHRGGPYGFPSCHAANSFALSVFVSLLYRCKWITVCMMLWALFTAYTRVVLGVHYPGDLLVGAVTGTCVAAAAYYSARNIYRRYPRRPVRDGKLHIALILGALWLTVLAMAVTACFSA